MVRWDCVIWVPAHRSFIPVTRIVSCCTLTLLTKFFKILLDIKMLLVIMQIEQREQEEQRDRDQEIRPNESESDGSFLRCPGVRKYTTVDRYRRMAATDKGGIDYVNAQYFLR
jgi:hypothetical protein